MSDETGVDERPQIKPFAAFLQEQRRGVAHTEISEALAELVQACVQTGKKGTLTLQIAVQPIKDADGTVYITDGVTVKAPRPDARPSMFFTDDHGNVSRQNPRQAELPIRAMDGGAGRADDGSDADRATGTEGLRS